jgi:tetratricopeptide (TPR) repeat protein
MCSLAVALGVATAFPSCGAAAEGISWHRTLQAALTASEGSGKPILLALETEWCGWCKKLDADTWPAEAVVAKAAEFECAKVDPEKTKGAERYDDGSYPRILFLTAEGDVLKEVGGYLPPEEFVPAMAEAQANIAKAKAIQELEQQVTGPEEDVAKSFQIGLLYSEIGRVKRALEWLKPVWEHQDQIPEEERVRLAMEYGGNLATDLQYEQALPILNGIVEQHADHALAREAWFALGFCQANLDRLVEARESWRKVVAGNAEDAIGRQAADLVERVTQTLGDR